MSFADGWAALNLEMPPRVPRTEFSAWRYWDLIRAVTGIVVAPESSAEQKQSASSAFMKAWNFDLRWATLIGNEDLAACRTDMGHAEYDAGGTDRREAGTCPFQAPEEVLAFDPWAVYGPQEHTTLVQRFEAHYRQQCTQTPDLVNMTGIYITLVSGLIEIFGWDMLLLAAGTDRTAFGRLADRYASWIQQYFDALAATSVPVVMVHDDIVWSTGPFMAPGWYREHVFPNYRTLLAPLRDAGKKILYTSDGNFTRFVDDIAACGVHGFVLEPWTDMAAIAERYGKTHVFVGNADTRILLTGTREEIRAEVQRCMDIGKQCPGYFMAVGNHIPANTPIENALYYNEVYEHLSRR
jgi:uroporphyrinogen-III decarboxylase